VTYQNYIEHDYTADYIAFYNRIIKAYIKVPFVKNLFQKNLKKLGKITLSSFTSKNTF
jgi:hypothetical protein